MNKIKDLVNKIRSDKGLSFVFGLLVFLLAINIISKCTSNNRYLYDKSNMAKIISEDKEKIDSLNSKIIEYRGMVNAMTGNHDDLVEKIKSMTTEILKCKREIDKKSSENSTKSSRKYVIRLWYYFTKRCQLLQ